MLVSVLSVAIHGNSRPLDGAALLDVPNNNTGRAIDMSRDRFTEVRIEEEGGTHPSPIGQHLDWLLPLSLDVA